MADPPFFDTADDIGVGRNRESTTGTPPWVKVLGIIVAVVVLLIVAMMFIGGGEHGPRRHALTGDDTGNTPLASVTEGHLPPGVDRG